MRLWKITIQNLIGDYIIWMGVGMTAIGTVLLASDMLMDLTGNK
jgi:hypothetical protein